MLFQCLVRDGGLAWSFPGAWAWPPRRTTIIITVVDRDFFAGVVVSLRKGADTSGICSWCRVAAAIWLVTGACRLCRRRQVDLGADPSGLVWGFDSTRFHCGAFRLSFVLSFVGCWRGGNWGVPWVGAWRNFAWEREVDTSRLCIWKFGFCGGRRGRWCESESTHFFR